MDMQHNVMSDTELHSAPNAKSLYESQFHPVTVQSIETGGADSKSGSRNYGNRYMKDFRKMVTSHNEQKVQEEAKEIPLHEEVMSNPKPSHTGFNSFIGSGSTPKDLKVQSKHKLTSMGNYGKAGTASKSFIVTDKPASQGRDKLMTDFLKKKIGIERFEKVEKILQDEKDPSALLKAPS